VAAINDVRIHIEGRSPEALWMPERQFLMEHPKTEHVPDAVVIYEQRRAAIEVELTFKHVRRVKTILDELQRRYDAVLYFCAAAPHRQLVGLQATGRWPGLGVRELPALEKKGTLEKKDYASE
jgi:hypothetical protein